MAIGTPTVGTKDERTAGSLSSTPSFPATVNAGDLLVLVGVSGASVNNVFSDPAGFNQQAQISNTGNTASPSVYLATKVAAGTETGTLSCPHTNVVTSMAIVAIPGVDTTTPLDIAVITVDKTVASTTISIPSQTVITAGALMLYVTSGNSTSLNATPPTTQGGWTELVDRTAASSRSWEVAYVGGLAAGATGTVTAAPGWTGTTKDVTIAIVARPAATATGLPELVMAPRN